MQRHNQEWLQDLPEAFQRYRDGRDVDEVECIVPDLAGMSRGKSMPVRMFDPQHETYLPVSIFYQTITGHDVEMDIANQWAEGDLVLKADMSTAKAVPWAKEPTLQIIHDLFDRDGNPVRIAPRNVLKHVVQLYTNKGWKPVVAPELEFYLIKPNIDPNEPIQSPIGRTGRRGSGNQSYSMSAVDDYGPVIDTIYDYAQHAGLTIDTVIQEDGAGQVEINLTHGDPVLLADQVFYFKRIIREAALNHGMFATFMAKPMRDQPGSAMHVHQSIIDVVSGNNIFSDAEGKASESFMHFIGGSQKYLPQALPLMAPYVNSYRRFEADSNSSAPTNFAWGFDNRATGLRVPNSSAENRRVENRVVGVDCNPYLAIAVGLACGYLGLLEKTEPGQPAAGELDDDAYNIPTTLDEALRRFESADAVHDILGQEFCMIYDEVKREEMRQFHREISPWEREHLLLNV
ncbi:glutamine synthetase family protein [Woeseia oceani]|uniref:Glutamine synthetase n=1 Tax=Woeseia oceani TaxID=1548547 RepID=A0A193LDY3_9GAMM|nr:glutamine synthetase family protein [Woeseia oceani]ANO50594.1 glutamine synthetase [Woeseia oceani]